MTHPAHLDLAALRIGQRSVGEPQEQPLEAAVITALRESLKRCSPQTVAAAVAFRFTGEYVHVPVIVTGIIERYIERDLRPLLRAGAGDLRLTEDLGVDSLTMMEIVLLTEETLGLTINNEELHALRTIDDVQRFIEGKLAPSLSNGPTGTSVAVTSITSACTAGDRFR